MGRGRGHPWGASGLLCCKDTKTRRISDRKRDSHGENEREGTALLNPHRERQGTLRGCKWTNFCETRSAWQERSCEVARNRLDNLRGAAYNGSDGRLGGRTAVTTLSIWPERTDARVGLPRGQDPEDGHRGWGFGLAVEVGLRSKLVLTCEPAVPRARSGIGSKGMQGRGSM
ncbi:hypothetical protein BGZ61DRAFT_523336 [Ilyonectria robusta]|uniref:uncharacterized protein n=1 Tax=Ilyonectria robusta TaxID=1079257 RepID=UPI001E8CD53B|nr:uncharacterized protein BGZ61DRAFT_523336 [Ilyonectria robusta]KAH8661201.1 hypothetical protein BGZ61DRAFT_523336 [Ilyonectria robusta]